MEIRLTISSPRLFFHASKDEVGAVSGQDALSIRLVPAFQLFDMRGQRRGPCRGRSGIGYGGRRSGDTDHAHPDR